MTSIDTDGVRPGDRITVHPDAALSAHTYRPLTHGVSLDVLSARPDHNGDIEVHGIALTTRGAWRAGVPSRSVILPAGSYTTPIRIGDSVRCPDIEELVTVTAIHVRADGTAYADVLLPDGVTEPGHNLVDLRQHARPTNPPTQRRCLRHHAADAQCLHCNCADEPVTTGCDAQQCLNPAVNLLGWGPAMSVRQVKALCQPHTDQVRAALAAETIRTIVLADGTRGYRPGGIQVATCRHCGHAINLYASMVGRRDPWRGHDFDETGRCQAAENRTRIRMLHEPATTHAERDLARAAAVCGPDAEQHLEQGCPSRQS